MRELIFPLTSTRVDTAGYIEEFTERAIGEVERKEGEGWGAFEGFGSGVDWPVSAFPEELLRSYPSAKFILTVRSSGSKWYNSVVNSICKFGDPSTLPWSMVMWLPVLPFSRIVKQRRMLDNVMMYKFVGDGKTDWRGVCEMGVERGEVVYDKWVEKVKGIIPEGQLMVFETGKHGYREVVEFLGLEEGIVGGDEEWPRVNSGAEFERIGRFVWFLVVLEVVVGGIVLVGVGRWIKGKTGTKEWNKKKSA